jgi:hypothetical protein
MQSENKLVFVPVEVDMENDKIFYEYEFHYSSDQMKFKFELVPEGEYPDDNTFIDAMKKNGNDEINGYIDDGKLSISTQNGFVTFHISRYGGCSSGSNNFSLKNEVCIEAIEAWLNHWRDNSEY